MREPGALLSAVLFITHPRLYQAGRDCLTKMAHHEAVSHALNEWPTIFNAVQVISNRETPFHRDTAGQPTWYDLLVTLGDYERAAMVFRNLGIQVTYCPGTVEVVASFLVHHGVAKVVPDRLCYAFFMTDAAHANHDIAPASWMTVDCYQ